MLLGLLNVSLMALTMWGFLSLFRVSTILPIWILFLSTGLITFLWLMVFAYVWSFVLGPSQLLFLLSIHVVVFNVFYFCASTTYPLFKINHVLWGYLTWIFLRVLVGALSFHGSLALAIHYIIVISYLVLAPIPFLPMKFLSLLERGFILRVFILFSSYEIL